MSLVARVAAKVRAAWHGSPHSPHDPLAHRLQRRRLLVASLRASMPYLRALFLVAGAVSLLLLPTRVSSNNVYVSENAIQATQANTYWNWGEVHKADEYANKVDIWRDLPAQERANEIKMTFLKMGLRAETQAFSFYNVGHPAHSNGTNVYAIIPATRADGAEALVLSASWKSRAKGKDVRGGDVNVRGVASALALAEYLKKMSLWSKDIIVLISDGFIEGTEAFVQSYHHEDHAPHVKIEPLVMKPGPIWAALELDFPYHSFDYIGIFYGAVAWPSYGLIMAKNDIRAEGLNGQLPNLDFINAAVHIIRYTGGVPVRLHDLSTDLRQDYLSARNPFHKLVDHIAWKRYELASETMLKQSLYGSLGSPTGPEGVFARFRIDSIAFFASPAEGPHGFYAFGHCVESTLRSLNNLLERLHHSFSLYLLQGTERFVSVSGYLPGIILASVAVTFTALQSWGFVLDAQQGGRLGDEKKTAQLEKAPVVMKALSRMGMFHLFGTMVFVTIHRLGWSSKDVVFLLPVLAALFPIIVKTQLSSTILPSTTCICIDLVQKPILLLISGCIMAVISTLNFPLGASLTLLYALPLSYFPTTHNKSFGWKVARYVLVWVSNPWTLTMLVWTSGGREVVERVWWDWYVLKTWFLPFIFVVVSPLVMQAAVMIL